ncbi:MAG: Mur ligase family protein [Gemmatimonadales bacterium]
MASNMTEMIVLTDSRRLPGLNLLWDRPGAVADIACPDDLTERFIARWQEQARRMLDALGWREELLTSRRFPNGASVAISAPVDGLFAATEINEWAVATATTRLAGGDSPPLEPARASLALQIGAEANPALAALHQAARQHQVTFLFDPDQVSVGGGIGSLTWPLNAIPSPDAVDWSAVHDVPLVLVTGSNGKTTTVRLLAAIAHQAGHVTGFSSTDAVVVNGEVIDRGDWAGPAGTRLVLRDRRVEFAVLETARGGILRRGLAVSRAVAAIVTNIAEDHFGEWGVSDLRALADTKLVVGRAVLPGGRLVLNADDPVLVTAATTLSVPILWTSLDSGSPLLQRHRAAGGEACWLADGSIILEQHGQTTEVASLTSIPITVNGTARHNVANVLGVVALAAASGLPLDAIRRGLTTFGVSPRDNPGRLNVYRIGEVTIVVDFAHNPHGMDALVAMATQLPARRRLVVLGQAGDRDDLALRQLAASAVAFRPDRVILKEMEKYLRERPPGQVGDVMEAEFLRLGIPAAHITRAPSEFEAVRSALDWAQPGDLLLLPTHAERGRVLAFLDQLERATWRPGDALPELT